MQNRIKLGIGKRFGGGKVFYLTRDKKHGLIVAREDLKERATFYELDDLISDQDNLDRVARDFVDWRLPTRHELNLIYKYKNKIGGFRDEVYWASSPEENDTAACQDFTDGLQRFSYKTVKNRVRVVREF